MFEWIRRRAIKVLRVPPEPEPPFGAPGSIRIFRAGRNYYKLRLFRWGLGQIGALIGIIISVGFLTKLHNDVPTARASIESLSRPVATAPAAPETSGVEATENTGEAPPPAKPPRRQRRNGYHEFAGRLPDWVLVLARLAEFGAITFFIVQLPVTLALVRLEYEQHWYIVTDRSLRIRNGLISLQESTMSFANLQQVEVKQDPLQRWLGLADLQVRSAGGGSDAAEAKGGDSLHRGVFQSVENAQEIRDLILERLRLFREAGLGDPDDLPAPADASLPPADVLTAAQELLAEARALRVEADRGSAPA